MYEYRSPDAEETQRQIFAATFARLVEHAAREGFNVEVTQVPFHPPAMGNYTTEVRVWRKQRPDRYPAKGSPLSAPTLAPVLPPGD